MASDSWCSFVEGGSDIFPTKILVDAYRGGPLKRFVTSISAEADPDNSGGPAVNREGEVVGTILASAGYGDVAGAIPSSVVAEQLDT